MRRLRLLAAVLLAGAVLFVSCKPNSESGSGSGAAGNGGNAAGGSGGGSPTEDTVTVEAGWYAYTAAVGERSQTTYLYINEDGSIERAGSDAHEFTGTELEGLKSTLNYAECKKAAEESSTVTFAKCSPPSWATIAGWYEYEDKNETFASLYNVLWLLFDDDGNVVRALDGLEGYKYGEFTGEKLSYIKQKYSYDKCENLYKFPAEDWEYYDAYPADGDEKWLFKTYKWWLFAYYDLKKYVILQYDDNMNVSRAGCCSDDNLSSPIEEYSGVELESAKTEYEIFHVREKEFQSKKYDFEPLSEEQIETVLAAWNK